MLVCECGKQYPARAARASSDHAKVSLNRSHGKLGIFEYKPSVSADSQLCGCSCVLMEAPWLRIQPVAKWTREHELGSEAEQPARDVL